MTRISETPNDTMPLRGPLQDGVDTIDLNQQVQFQAYTRVVLPLDKYVFWSPTTKLCASGSLHYSQEMEQREDETVGVATVTFTSQKRITEFSESPVSTIYVAEHCGFRYAFSQQSGHYEQAGLWHYFGHLVYPALESQLLDRPDAIDPNRAVVSNSLALWLSLNSWSSPYNAGFKTGITLYPAYLVDSNLTPPYGAVDIEDTYPLQAVPYIDGERNHWQLVADRVTITLYGLQSNEAMDFVDAINSYSVLTENFGLMNTPVISDGKRPQPELQAIAMQKKITYEVNYYQTRVADIARQLILSAQAAILIRD